MKKRVTPTPLPEHVQRATKLLEAIHKIRTHKRLFRAPRPNIQETAKQFALLTAELSFDHARLDQVLDWFILHCTEPYTPIITNGKMFHQKFLNVEAAMQKWKRENPQVEIGQWAREFVFPDPNGLGMDTRTWGKSLVRKMEIAVQLTLNYYTHFYSHFGDVDVNDVSHPLSVYKFYFPFPPIFTATWWEAIYSRPWFRPENKSAIHPLDFVFRLDRPRSVRWLRELADQYGLRLDYLRSFIEKEQRWLKGE